MENQMDIDIDMGEPMEVDSESDNEKKVDGEVCILTRLFEFSLESKLVFWEITTGAMPTSGFIN